MCSDRSDPLARLGAAIDAMAAADPRALTDAEIETRIVGLHRATARLQAELVGAIRLAEKRQSWAVDGARSLVGWLRMTCRMAKGAAKAYARLGRRLEDLPVVDEAFRAGVIDYAHARAIATKTADLPAEDVAKHERTLVDLATRANPADTYKALAHLRYLIDPNKATLDAEHARELRYLDVSRTFDGMVALNGMFDPEAGETLLTAINALCPPPRPGDNRTSRRKRADALTTICSWSLSSGKLPSSGGERPHINVVVDWSTLVHGVGAGALSNDEPIDVESIRRLLCDAMVSRVVTNGKSEILDLGRKTRVISPAQRRALRIRDRHCRFDGCDMPADYCDAHHLIHWMLGGPTDLSNEALLCRYHHTVTHSNDIEVSWHNGCPTIRLRDGPLTKAA